MRKGWKIIIREILKHQSDVRLLIVLGIITAIANGSVPYVVGRFFDALIHISSTNSIGLPGFPAWLVLLMVWFCIQAAANIADWIQEKKSGDVSIRIETTYLAEGFGQLLLLPTTFHKNKKVGEVGDAMSRAANWLDQISSNVVFSLAPQFLSVIVGMVFVIWIQPIVALMLTIGIVLYVLVLWRIVPPSVPLQRKGYKAYGDAYGDAYGALGNIQTIKHAVAEEYEQKKLKGMFMQRAGKLWFRLIRVWAKVNVSQRLIVTAVQLSIFVWSVVLIAHGSLTIGQLIALNGYASMVFGPFVRVGFLWQTIQNGLTALERADGLLSTPTEVYTPKDAHVFERVNGAIEFKNVNFSYHINEKPVLKKISASIKPGERIALVGESGVGKSTLIELISAYYFPNEGMVTIDGYDTRTVDLRSLRSHIAIVPQEIVLFNDTVAHNIRYGSFKASDAAIREAARRAHADQFIESFRKKYDQIVGERGIKLSTGQKQRIAIARAILRNPSILILDEPTSALDIQTEKFITESLEDLMQGRTTIIIAHRLSTVRKADRIFVLEGGAIVETGTHDELVQKEEGVYRKLHDLHLSLS